MDLSKLPFNTIILCITNILHNQSIIIYCVLIINKDVTRGCGGGSVGKALPVLAEAVVVVVVVLPVMFAYKCMY